MRWPWKLKRKPEPTPLDEAKQNLYEVNEKINQDVDKIKKSVIKLGFDFHKDQE